MKQDKLYVVKRLVDRKELSLHFRANQGQKRSAGRAGTCNNSRGEGGDLESWKREDGNMYFRREGEGGR